MRRYCNPSNLFRFSFCLFVAILLGCSNPTHFTQDEIVYLAEGADGHFQLFALDPFDPNPKQLTNLHRDIFEFAISPQGFVAFTLIDEDQSHDIWLLWDDEPGH